MKGLQIGWTSKLDKDGWPSDLFLMVSFEWPVKGGTMLFRARVTEGDSAEETARVLGGLVREMMKERGERGELAMKGTALNAVELTRPKART